MSNSIFLVKIPKDLLDKKADDVPDIEGFIAESILDALNERYHGYTITVVCIND